VTATGPATELAAVATSAQPLAVPVLTFHRVNHLAPDATATRRRLTVAPDRFACHLHALADAGYRSIRSAELSAALRGAASLPERPIILTFDDGYRDCVERVLPALCEHGFGATFFVLMDRWHGSEWLDPAGIRQLQDAGMELGAHTRTHVDLTTVGPGEAREEIVRSREELRELSGAAVTSFAYPYGAFDDRVVAEVARAGFETAFTTQAGFVTSSCAPLTLPRLRVPGGLTTEALLELLSQRPAAA
jgi:peptidoglycan/xylan/chitin deacetylase (PgdA/CDA1 family)